MTCNILILLPTNTVHFSIPSLPPPPQKKNGKKERNFLSYSFQTPGNQNISLSACY